MTNYCAICEKTHDDFAWRSTFDHKDQLITFCSLYFRSPVHEWVPQRIKDERKQYAKDILQPWREGEPSAEFAEAYPQQAKHYFKDEKRAPRRVWKDL